MPATMTIYAFEAQETWLPSVIGMICSAVELDDEDTLLLHFGATQTAPDGQLEAERTISLAGVWRVERADEVRAASGDNEDDASRENLKPLVGTLLQRVQVSHPGFDLTLELSEGHVVRCFPCDSGEFAEEVEGDEEAIIAWWVDGIGIPDDWEEPNDAFFEET
jgi:hypothetical protein